MFYREQSKLGVEWTLGALNDEGSREELVVENVPSVPLAPNHLGVLVGGHRRFVPAPT